MSDITREAIVKCLVEQWYGPADAQRVAKSRQYLRVMVSDGYEADEGMTLDLFATKLIEALGITESLT